MNGGNSLPERSKVQILFVCTGNTCRSPMAEYLFNSLTDGNSFHAVSAGLYAFDGEAMSENSLAVLEENGIDGSPFRSQSVTYELMMNSHLVIAMTASHLTELQMRYEEFAGKCRTLTEFSGSCGISDPFGQNIAVYRRTFCEIKQNLENWINFLNNK